jgi:capsular exopolysaccharide synthesis family protein
MSIDFVRLLKQYKWILAASLVIGAALGTASHFVLLRVAPRYQSKVTYLTLPPVPDLVNRGQQNFTDLNEMERYAQTQARLMRSDRIIRDALKQPRIRNETAWAKQFITVDGQLDPIKSWEALREDVSAAVVTNTTLVELSVNSRNPNDASLIANEIHDAYWRDLSATNSNASREQRDALNKRANDLRTEIARFEDRRTRLLSENNINSQSPEINVEAELVRVLDPELARIRQSLERLRVDLKRMKDQLEAEGVPQFGDDMREEAERDNVVQQLKGDIANLKSILAANEARGFGSEHKDVVRVRELIRSKEAELDTVRNQKLRQLFDAQMTNTRNSISGLEAQLVETEQRRNDAVKRREDITRVLSEYDSLGKQLDDLRRERGDVTSRLAEIASQDLMFGQNRIGRMRLIEQARPADSPTFPRLPIMLGLGVVLISGLTGGFLLVREFLDQRVKGPSDALLIRGARLVGVIPSAADDPSRPASPETAFRDAPSGILAESFRQMRPGLLKKMHHAGHKSLLIVGAGPDSGATTIVSNLGIACATSDQKVLLIDANLRRPGLHKCFKLGEGPGLGNVLAKSATFNEAVQQTSVPNLHLLSAGTAQARGNPERLATDQMRQLIAEAAAGYDLVIIDAAPVLVAGDAIAIANRCDASILVARAMAEKRGLIARMREQLADARAELLGIVVNAVKASAGGYMRGNIRASFEYQNGDQAA